MSLPLKTVNYGNNENFNYQIRHLSAEGGKCSQLKQIFTPLVTEYHSRSAAYSSLERQYCLLWNYFDGYLFQVCFCKTTNNFKLGVSLCCKPQLHMSLVSNFLFLSCHNTVLLLWLGLGTKPCWGKHHDFVKNACFGNRKHGWKCLEVSLKTAGSVATITSGYFWWKKSSAVLLANVKNTVIPHHKTSSFFTCRLKLPWPKKSYRLQGYQPCSL